MSAARKLNIDIKKKLTKVPKNAKSESFVIQIRNIVDHSFSVFNSSDGYRNSYLFDLFATEYKLKNSDTKSYFLKDHIVGAFIEVNYPRFLKGKKIVSMSDVYEKFLNVAPKKIDNCKSTTRFTCRVYYSDSNTNKVHSDPEIGYNTVNVLNALILKYTQNTHIGKILTPERFIKDVLIKDFCEINYQRYRQGDDIITLRELA